MTGPGDGDNGAGHGGSGGAAAFKLVADFWVLRIVEELGGTDSGVRFSSLQRALGEVSPATLSGRLRMMETEGLLERDTGAHHGRGSASVSYRLTDRGDQLVPIARAIRTFAAG
ncbi:transcriptional regulator [Nakamurella silvestris]|nr:transcriptional regulator [Nakamurella silvestris]